MLKKEVPLYHVGNFTSLPIYPTTGKRDDLKPLSLVTFLADKKSAILKETVQRFETGVYACWYPIKQRAQIDTFHRNIQASLLRPVLVVELSLFPEDLPFHLNGCGMLIVNPPWQLDEILNSTLSWLLSKLSPDQGLYSVKTLIK